MKRKTLAFYILTIIVFGVLIYWTTQQGAKLEVGKVADDIVKVDSSKTPFQLFIENFAHGLMHPLAILLVQIISIILVSRTFGFIFNKIGQPTVIGEIIAGIVLGPSVVGLFFPEVSSFLFPVGSLPNLQFLSQIGLILFMFVIGMELDLKVLRNQAHDAVVTYISLAIEF